MMMQIINKKYTEKFFAKADIFICAFGYEKRSFFLYEKIENIAKEQNVLIFYFENSLDSRRIEGLKKRGIECVTATYNSGEFVQKKICNYIQSKMNCNEEFVVHIDYSSMPRNWYYNLPIKLKDLHVESNFWYVVGKYPFEYTEYPTSGIEAYTVIGKPSLRSVQRRLHIFGLSYDFVRTKALLSEIDPDIYITCNAYDLANVERCENVNILNQQIRSNAIDEISLCYDDFSFMFSKLCEIANEYSYSGSVIFVPDGPKPLVFAMSLVPLYLKKEGISCLHVYRNNKFLSKVDVEPTESIIGFRCVAD